MRAFGAHSIIEPSQSGGHLMLNVEQEGVGSTGSGETQSVQPASQAGDIHASGPLSYGSYLRVPEILSLQTPLGGPGAHDEMLFIIVQQVQELWFKQILYELRDVIDLLGRDEIRPAVRLIDRVNRIIRLVGDEVAILETMPPQEFMRFRNVLSPASGFESEQFRELEWASGLREHTFVKLVEKHADLQIYGARWPVSLHDALLQQLDRVDTDPASAVAGIYLDPGAHPDLYSLVEVLSEYEVLFGEWRFHHIKLVERTIGDHSPGTAGSAGAGYLGRTLTYRFFPELWEARNRISASASSM
jgi:tryptophan 2,3-dioxygenase